jgi:hypothetical protein
MLHPYRPSLATTGFLISAAIGLYMIVTILISDRRRE